MEMGPRLVTGEALNQTHEVFAYTMKTSGTVFNVIQLSKLEFSITILGVGWGRGRH